MTEKISRRTFLASTTAVGIGGSTLECLEASNVPAQTAASRPLVIASVNGMKATAKAMEMIRSGADVLDAVIAGVNIVEDDPDDNSVGYGGLPNEDGEVELDASVMHGPTARCGAVGALKFIKNPSKVARLVMQRCDHIFLVGEGALRFALAHGFQKENLLTEKSRELWLRWKENMSEKDNWLAPESGPSRESALALMTYGTINCCAVNDKGDLAGVTTTSGLSWKLAGRVGDSPIIGAGLYVDNEVGAAGSTGRGEANIKVCGAHTVVEMMRLGKSPEEACLEALKRVVKTTTEKRLLNEQGRPNFGLSYYAIDKKGAYGGASLYSGSRFCINDGSASRQVECAYLFQREARRPRD
jgi:N4-(beta-N-acetylglucosaminyl)-L-asparaginase